VGQAAGAGGWWMAMGWLPQKAMGELECFSSGKASALAPRCSASTPAGQALDRTVSPLEPVP